MRLFILFISVFLFNIVEYIDPAKKLSFTVKGTYKTETIYEPTSSQEVQSIIIYDTNNLEDQNATRCLKYLPQAKK